MVRINQGTYEHDEKLFKTDQPDVNNISSKIENKSSTKIDIMAKAKEMETLREQIDTSVKPPIGYKQQTLNPQV